MSAFTHIVQACLIIAAVGLVMFSIRLWIEDRREAKAKLIEAEALAGQALQELSIAGSLDHLTPNEIDDLYQYYVVQNLQSV